MSNQSIQVLVAWSLDPKISPANVIDSLIVDHEAAIGVLEGSMCRQDRVVGLDNRSSDLGSWIDAKLQFGLLAIVDRQAFHEQSAEAGPSTTTERVEHEETLEARAIVCDTTNLVQDLINQLLADGVVTTGVIVGRILLSSNHLLWMEKIPIGTCADFVDDIGFEVTVDGARYMFAIAYSKQRSATLPSVQLWRLKMRRTP